MVHGYAIVAGNLDYSTLLASNILHYSKIENSLLFDAWKVIKAVGKKIVNEAFDLFIREGVDKFIEENRIRNEK